eukprot:scaffold87967_cov37-Tisochrysis_lutea.AAC.1
MVDGGGDLRLESQAPDIKDQDQGLHYIKYSGCDKDTAHDSPRYGRYGSRLSSFCFLLDMVGTGLGGTGASRRPVTTDYGRSVDTAVVSGLFHVARSP